MLKLDEQEVPRVTPENDGTLFVSPRNPTSPEKNLWSEVLFRLVCDLQIWDRHYCGKAECGTMRKVGKGPYAGKARHFYCTPCQEAIRAQWEARNYQEEDLELLCEMAGVEDIAAIKKMIADLPETPNPDNLWRPSPMRLYLERKAESRP